MEIIATVTGPQLRAVLTFKPKTFAAWRIYAFDCLLVDAGLRADEALWLAPSDIDVCSICLVALEDGSDELRCELGIKLAPQGFMRKKQRDGTGTKALSTSVLVSVKPRTGRSRT